VKGTCPPSADSGQVPKAKEDKLTKVLSRTGKQKSKRGLTGLPSLHELVQNEVKEGKLTNILALTGNKNLKRGPLMSPF
jgi:hypothetical protein